MRPSLSYCDQPFRKLSENLADLNANIAELIVKEKEGRRVFLKREYEHKLYSAGHSKQEANSDGFL